MINKLHNQTIYKSGWNFIRPDFFIIFLVTFILLCISCNKHQPEQLVDGVEVIVDGQLYVVHSMIYAKEKPWTTSNIFVLKGTNDTVWIFGSGYGDFNLPCEDECNDNNYYLGDLFSGTGPATEDVRFVDSIITNVFGISRDSVILQFIVPHYHNDHINSEFIDAFYNAFNYPLRSGEKIWIHYNDSIGALCDEPCCGTEPCPDKKNKYYGVPYLPHWKEAYKSMFTTMGTAFDSCNQIIKSFSSASGTWTITKSVSVKDEGHTDGTINLNNQNLKMRIAGTKSKVQCYLPKNWRMISVHGNINSGTDDRTPPE